MLQVWNALRNPAAVPEHHHELADAGADPAVRPHQTRKADHPRQGQALHRCVFTVGYVA